MDFSDPGHSSMEIVFQGAQEAEIETLCNDKVIAALARWRERAPQSDPYPELFRLEETRSFVITYEGNTDEYWPDRPSNVIGETIIREFLFSSGICDLEGLAPRLYVAKYKVQAMIDTEYLLTCPYPTEAGNIGGLLVVCVNEQLRTID